MARGRCGRRRSASSRRGSTPSSASCSASCCRFRSMRPASPSPARSAARSSPSWRPRWPIRWCGTAAARLDAFPRATLQGNIGYVAPIAALTYAPIAVLLLLLRTDYSRVQFFGSGILTLLWMAGVAQLRSRYLIRNYAVMPHSSIADMPVLATCRWLDFDDVQKPRHAGRCHRRRSRRRSGRGAGSPPWRTPRSPACRCSIDATSSRR